MATSNRDRVGKALEVLNAGLYPFFERELRTAYGDKWEEIVRGGSRDGRGSDAGKGISWDTTAMLSGMLNNWNAFRGTLGQTDRGIAGELRDVRNNWAHQQGFTIDDTYRALDSIYRLLTDVGAVEQAQEIDRQKHEVLRLRFEEQARQETRKAAAIRIEGQPAVGLRPWREIITPHPDVATGTYQQAEFAADLNQVHQGLGSDEYRHPRAFFERTFLTEGLRQLLTNALLRLTKGGGDPVVKLETNFGGGKTHSMLALYHLCSGAQPTDLPGIEPVLQGARVTTLPPVQRVVLVGTALSPARQQHKPDGTVVHTLWGELAWQLLGPEGYALVAAADQQGVSPGANALIDLFTAATPCLILIDEWVAYVRQLYIHPDDADKSVKRAYPGGSFEANMTFAQALTEAAKAVPGVLLVASLPASDIETGGEGGREALTRLQHIFGRVESAWRPATTEEGFEIVRRRLFQPLNDPQLFAARDAVVKGFMELYRSQSAEFPAECREADYARRLTQAYPIHPELFERLYNDWCTIDSFQRTRGVLRLMSAVIHMLWERDDRSLLIMPASVPLSAPTVQSNLTQYLEPTWPTVIEKDVDGPSSLPLRLDNDNPNLGRVSACRRVARTIFIGSAATLHLAQRGLADQRIRLGCVQPGEHAPVFGDALRRLTDQATHLYVDGQRSWFSTQPTVNRLAQDRAAQQSDDAVLTALLKQLRQQEKQRGDFAAVHIAPLVPADVPDERDARLVILPPTVSHSARATNSSARQLAEKLLAERGSGPRQYKNALVFLAADATRLNELDQALRQALAWASIDDERDLLNLDAFQARQAQHKRKQAEESIKQRIPETFVWLLYPEQPEPQGGSGWGEARLQGQDVLAVRAARKLRNDDLLITQLGGTVLRMWLDKIPLWGGARGDHVSIRQLVDDFAQYLYLPRIQNAHVIHEAVQNGVALLTWEQDTFAYAERYDVDSARYGGLRTGAVGGVIAAGLVVKPTQARQQLDAEEAAQCAVTPPPPPTSPVPLPPDARDNTSPEASGTSVSSDASGTSVSPPSPTPRRERTLRRFHGSKRLDTARMSRDADTIATEVVQHLASLMGARVRITIEIEADLPEGAPDQVVRTVTENCRTLRFESSGFEEI